MWLGKNDSSWFTPIPITVATGSIWDPRCIAMSYFGNGPRFDPDLKLSTIHDSSFWGCFLGEWLTCKIRFQANNGEDMHPMTQCRWGGCHDDRLLAVPPPHDILPEIIHDIHVVTMLWVLLESSQEMGLVHRAQDISESVPQKYSSIVVIKIQRFDEFYPTCSSMFMAKIQRFLSPRVLCHEESWGS